MFMFIRFLLSIDLVLINFKPLMVIRRVYKRAGECGLLILIPEVLSVLTRSS